MQPVVTLATRRSELALRQTHLAAEHLRIRFPDTRFEILELVTTGDKQRKLSMEKDGGKGLFTKELEEALMDGRADVAVHSAKDLPTENPEGLTLAAFLPREAVNDVLVRHRDAKKIQFIATSSPRRRAQCKGLYPCAAYNEIRGNVGTRLKKIARREADATLLALAGLRRLGIDAWKELVFEPLEIDRMVPAVGQGAIALQTRVEDAVAFAPAGDAATREAVVLERAFLRALGGGCHTAFGGHVSGDTLHAFHEDVGRETLSFASREEAARREEIAAFAEALLRKARDGEAD